MKALPSIFVATLLAGASLSCLAVSQQSDSSTAAQRPAQAIGKSGEEVHTSDVGYATPQMLKLDPQVVMSQGGSLRPGPHNRHFRPPHGGPVTAGDRSEVPGRE